MHKVYNYYYFDMKIIDIQYVHVHVYSIHFLYSDGFPIGTGSSIQKTYELVPLLEKNRVTSPLIHWLCD